VSFLAGGTGGKGDGAHTYVCALPYLWPFLAWSRGRIDSSEAEMSTPFDGRCGRRHIAQLVQNANEAAVGSTSSSYQQTSAHDALVQVRGQF
jgi:hypothetical protein